VGAAAAAGDGQSAALNKNQRKKAKKKAKKAAKAAAAAAGGEEGGSDDEEGGTQSMQVGGDESELDTSVAPSVSHQAAAAGGAGADGSSDVPSSTEAMSGLRLSGSSPALVKEGGGVATGAAGGEPSTQAHEPSTNGAMETDAVEDPDQLPATAGADGSDAAAAAPEPGRVRMILSPGLTDEQLLTARCKLVDFGNACWTYKQFTSDIQTRQYRCDREEGVV
jgi:serine/threonine-protein kinase SRPK3